MPWRSGGWWQSARDYYDGELERDDALDLVLRYIGDVPVATPVPVRAEPTPTPAPTAIPTPRPPTYDMLSCRRELEHGSFYGKPIYGSNYGKRIAEHEHQEMDVTFINPDWPTWAIDIRWASHVLALDNCGEWETRENIRQAYPYGLTLTGAGVVADRGVLFHTGTGERNQLSLLAVNGSSRLYVNGGVFATWEDRAPFSISTWHYSLHSTMLHQHYEYLCLGPPSL